MNVARVLRALPRTRNLVLLASDMKGFTARTSSQTREQNQRMLALHDGLLLPVLRGYGARKVKGLGDALVAAFTSPTDAVLCAMAMQDRLAAWNAHAAPRDRIEVRIALSQGEVRKEGKELVGEPVQLALDAQAVAEAGDVILTDAVYLSMNKCEAPTEVLGHRLLRGGGSIRLRRALRGPDPEAPYAGHALSRLGRLPDPAPGLAPNSPVRLVLEPLRRRAPLAAAACLLVAAAAGESHRESPKDPVLRAAALLDARQPTAALAELDKVAESARAKDPRVEVLRGKAEHSLGQLGLAFSDFASAAQADPRTLDGAAIAMLAEDVESETFPRLWRPALVRLLGETLGQKAGPAVRRLVASPRARVRADAIEILELAGLSTDDDRLAAARAALADSQATCIERRRAIKSLAVVRDPSGADLLRRASDESRSCGAREARDVLRRLARI